MLIKRSEEPRSAEITDPRDYLCRREFLRGAAGVGVGLATPLAACFRTDDSSAGEKGAEPARLDASAPPDPRDSTDEARTSYEDATSYNNFYEFGTDKTDPARLAGEFRPRPWSVAIEGEVARPGVVPLEDLLKPHPLEERVYRLRCVEAWSMVIPWLGFPLRDLLARFDPSSQAKYVAFDTVLRPEEMPGQRRPILDWPYREGLRIDEAMHPLTILAVGMYGRVLPNQNGAPLRLVVPWKYGFKSIKSIVRIRLMAEQPTTSWSASRPDEYGFYANVNPEVDHPRWSQARERRIGEFRKRPTLPMNGYAEQVAHLYRGMDLRKFF